MTRATSSGALAKHLYVDRFEHDGTAYKDLLGEIELARSEGKMNVVVDTASNDPIPVEVIDGVRDVFMYNLYYGD